MDLSRVGSRLGCLASRRPVVIAVSIGAFVLLTVSCDLTNVSDGDGGTVAGELTERDSPTVRQDGTEIFSGDDLFEQADLTTSSGGAGDFYVSLGDTSCGIGGSSDVTIRPSSEVILQVNAASSVICGLGSKTGDQRFTAGNVEVKSFDPIVSFSVDAEGAVVKSHYGFVSVTSLETGESVGVGPLRQVTVPTGDGPGPVVPVEVTAFEQTKLPGLLEIVPAPDPLAILERSESVTLRRMVESATLVVYLDAEAGNEAVEVFVLQLGEEQFFETRLGVDFVVDIADRGSAFDLIADESVAAAFVTPVPLEGADAGGFFTDNEGQLWELNVLDDPAFRPAFADLMGSLLTDGDFDRIHARFFEVPLSYQAVLAR